MGICPAADEACQIRTSPAERAAGSAAPELRLGRRPARSASAKKAARTRKRRAARRSARPWTYRVDSTFILRQSRTSARKALGAYAAGRGLISRLKSLWSPSHEPSMSRDHILRTVFGAARRTPRLATGARHLRTARRLAGEGRPGRSAAGHPLLLLLAERRGGLFAVLTKRRLRRGSFGSLVDLQAAINRYLERSTTPTQNRSSGPPSRTASSRKYAVGIKRLGWSTRPGACRRG